MSQIRKLAGQTAIYGLSSIVGRLLNYLLVPLYTRIFHPDAYGVVSEFYAYLPFLMILYSYGVETAYFHFVNDEKEDQRGRTYKICLSMLFYSTLFFSFLLLVFAPSLANSLGHAAHPEYITWFACILAFDTLTALPFARLRKEGRAKMFAGLRLLGIGINIGLNLFFFLLLPDLAKSAPDGWMDALYIPDQGIAYVFLANLISSAIVFAFVMHDYRTLIAVKWEDIKPILVYSWPLLIAGMAGMINETFDRAVYKYLAPEPAKAMFELGIYSANYKLSMLMTIFVQTFRYASEPFFFSRRNNDNSRELMARIMDYFILACCLIFLLVMLYIDFVSLFIGADYRSGLHVVPVLLLANLCLGVYLNLSMWYKLSGETRYGALFSMAGALVTVLGLFLLVPVFGYTGAAWATLISYFTMMLISAMVGRKKFPVPYRISLHITYVALAVFLWLLSQWMASAYPLHLITRTIVNTILLLIYIGLMWKISGFSRKMFPKQA